jgi:hypothetical protein
MSRRFLEQCRKRILLAACAVLAFAGVTDADTPKQMRGTWCHIGDSTSYSPRASFYKRCVPTKAELAEGIAEGDEVITIERNGFRGDESAGCHRAVSKRVDHGYTRVVFTDCDEYLDTPSVTMDMALDRGFLYLRDLKDLPE